MKDIWNFALRNASWLSICLIALILLKPGIEELRTLMLIGAVESLAMALSGVASYAYTHIDFTDKALKSSSNLGYIFLGVHLLTGLVVLGVYLAQFA